MRRRPAGRDRTAIPSLTPRLGAAFWYERAIHDLFGVVPQGHPRLDPLLLPQRRRRDPPRPGAPGGPAAIEPDQRSLPPHVTGPGLFTIPHGPVRSGVVESIEYLVETPGEDIPHLNIRVLYKHRGHREALRGPAPSADGVLLAERVEGIASVAHALAYCHAIERIAGIEVPWPAALIRVLHAELERIANHLDVAVRLSDAAGLAVATARFGWHKERVLRLVSRLCGSRFGRGVVVPGGVSALPAVSRPANSLAEIGRLERAVTADVAAADGHGVVPGPAARHRAAAPGPGPRARRARPGRPGSGFDDDDRRHRPYDAYASLGARPPDAIDRPVMRWPGCRSAGTRSPVVPPAPPGRRTSSPTPVTAPLRAGLRRRPTGGRSAGPRPRRARCSTTSGWRTAGSALPPRSASFHNLVLFHDVFDGDILTDFPFIEASFGLSVAGVAM